MFHFNLDSNPQACFILTDSNYIYGVNGENKYQVTNVAKTNSAN